jgi:hypothetical protein
MTYKSKKHHGLDFKTFLGKDGKPYLVFRTPKGAYNAFAEVEAKAAAYDCGAERGTPTKDTPRSLWRSLWDQQ